MHLSKKIGKLILILIYIHTFSSSSLEHEKQQCEDQLNKVNILIKYFREKLTEHGLNTDLTPTSELTSPLYHPLTHSEEQAIVSSYMEDNNSDHISSPKIPSYEPPTAIAMKLPRNFASLNLNLTTTNEIIHSPYYDGNEIEYKKELLSDILNKYGGQTKKETKRQELSLTGKNH
jgi:hypothetical protein